jgi:hypothetical protein
MKLINIAFIVLATLTGSAAFASEKYSNKLTTKLMSCSGLAQMLDNKSEAYDFHVMSLAILSGNGMSKEDSIDNVTEHSSWMKGYASGYAASAEIDKKQMAEVLYDRMCKKLEPTAAKFLKDRGAPTFESLTRK